MTTAETDTTMPTTETGTTMTTTASGTTIMIMTGSLQYIIYFFIIFLNVFEQ
jgi:hypothetical protein